MKLHHCKLCKSWSDLGSITLISRAANYTPPVNWKCKAGSGGWSILRLEIMWSAQFFLFSDKIYFPLRITPTTARIRLLYLVCFLVEASALLTMLWHPMATFVQGEDESFIRGSNTTWTPTTFPLRRSEFSLCQPPVGNKHATKVDIYLPNMFQIRCN